MTLGDRLERRPEVSERLDVIELAGLDEAGDAGPGLRAFVVSCEQMILSAKSQRTDAILNGVAVHLNTAVREEHLQPALAVGYYEFCYEVDNTNFSKRDKRRSN